MKHSVTQAVSEVLAYNLNKLKEDTTMAPQQKRCLNPTCGTEYTIDSNDIDDGFCSYTCWEHVNCDSPKKTTDIFNTSVEEILNMKKT
jgi:hypothetical protein